METERMKIRARFLKNNAWTSWVFFLYLFFNEQKVAMAHLFQMLTHVCGRS